MSQSEYVSAFKSPIRSGSARIGSRELSIRVRQYAYLHFLALIYNRTSLGSAYCLARINRFNVEVASLYKVANYCRFCSFIKVQHFQIKTTTCSYCDVVEFSGCRCIPAERAACSSTFEFDGLINPPKKTRSHLSLCLSLYQKKSWH